MKYKSLILIIIYITNIYMYILVYRYIERKRLLNVLSSHIEFMRIFLYFHECEIH